MSQFPTQSLLQKSAPVKKVKKFKDFETTDLFPTIEDAINEINNNNLSSESSVNEKSLCQIDFSGLKQELQNNNCEIYNYQDDSPSKISKKVSKTEIKMKFFVIILQSFFLKFFNLTYTHKIIIIKRLKK